MFLDARRYSGTVPLQAVVSNLVSSLTQFGY
jgi:hypothetical protein